MKKLFLVVVLALVGFSCFAQREGRHSYYSSCNVYAGQKYSAWYWYEHNTREKAEAEVFFHVGSKKMEKAKPYKNEVDTAFKVIKEHWTPKRGELYSISTFPDDDYFFIVREIYIWMDNDYSYYYWVYEYKQLL